MKIISIFIIVLFSCSSKELPKEEIVEKVIKKKQTTSVKIIKPSSSKRSAERKIKKKDIERNDLLIRNDSLILITKNIPKKELDVAKYVQKLINGKTRWWYKTTLTKYDGGYKHWPSKIASLLKTHSEYIKQLIFFSHMNKKMWSITRYNKTIRYLIDLPINSVKKDELTINLIKSIGRLDVHFFDDLQFLNLSNKVYFFLNQTYQVNTYYDAYVFIHLKLNKLKSYNNDLANLIKEKKIIVPSYFQDMFFETNSNYNESSFKDFSKTRSYVETSISEGDYYEEN